VNLLRFGSDLASYDRLADLSLPLNEISLTSKVINKAIVFLINLKI